MFIDTHCHLDFSEFKEDRDEVIQRAKAARLDYIVNIGSSLEGSRKSVELAKKYDFIYASVGLHPHEADKADNDTQAALRDLAAQDKVVAIGETGLDYYKNYSQQENQRRLFSHLLNLAHEMALPLIIHNRQANEETLGILKEAMPKKAVVHCFSGDEGFLKACLGLGFFVSFTCNITYKKAQNLRDLVKLVPLDRLMLETDAPFLPPEGLRGRRCEPMYVRQLAEEVARIKGISIPETAQVTTHNAKGFFKLP